MEVDVGGSETMDVQTERKESIVKLKEKDERDKMFTFVKSLSEVIEDKHAVFGVFRKCPDKVMP